MVFPDADDNGAVGSEPPTALSPVVVSSDSSPESITESPSSSTSCTLADLALEFRADSSSCKLSAVTWCYYAGTHELVCDVDRFSVTLQCLVVDEGLVFRLV